MNFIDKLIVLIENEGKAAAAAGGPCWNGPPAKFPGTVVSRSSPSTSEGVVNWITYSFPLNDPCITRIVNEVNGGKIKMCGPSGVGVPCCLRRNLNRTKCVEINTLFLVPYEGSGLSPPGLDPNHLQIPPGSPILVVGTINVYPSGYDFTTRGAKPHLADLDALPLDGQTSYINLYR